MAAELVTLEPEPLDPDVEALVEDLAAKVAEGRVAALAVAVVYRDGTVGQMNTDSGSFVRLLGAVNRLAYVLNQGMESADAL